MDASVSPDRCANGNFVNVINLRAETCSKHIFCCLCSICQVILKASFIAEFLENETNEPNEISW